MASEAAPPKRNRDLIILMQLHVTFIPCACACRGAKVVVKGLKYRSMVMGVWPSLVGHTPLSYFVAPTTLILSASQMPIT